MPDERLGSGPGRASPITLPYLCAELTSPRPWARGLAYAIERRTLGTGQCLGYPPRTWFPRGAYPMPPTLVANEQPILDCRVMERLPPLLYGSSPLLGGTPLHGTGAHSRGHWTTGAELPGWQAEAGIRGRPVSREAHTCPIDRRLSSPPIGVLPTRLDVSPLWCQYYPPYLELPVEGMHTP